MREKRRPAVVVVVFVVSVGEQDDGVDPLWIGVTGDRVERIARRGVER